MKRRRPELTVFSMSALDLLASALGAFILITVVLLPLFPNLEILGQVRGELARARTELKQTKADLDLALAELDQKESRSRLGRAELERRNVELKEAKARLEQRRDLAQQTKTELVEQVETLQQEIDDTSVLLGIKTKARRFVFVIDMSGSIYHPGEHDYRQFIRLSIQDMLAAFKSEIEVCLIGFHAPNRKTTLHYWPESKEYFQVRKDAQNQLVEQIDAWMGMVDGVTPTRAALLAAIALHPEEIILLSDGAPSEDWRTVVRSVTAENKQRIPIHAVAVGNYTADRKFIDFLVHLTKRNNGYVVGAKPG